MIRKVVILGGGSAGLLAALSVKTKLPLLEVRLILSRAIGVIGVGESSIRDLPNHLHGHLKLDPAAFFKAVDPSYKLGIRFLWGPREEFYYPFSGATTAAVNGMSQYAGFACFDDMNDMDVNAALMRRGLAFARQADGAPLLRDNVAYHLENVHLVSYLEREAVSRGVRITDGIMQRAEPGPEGIAALHMEDGERVTADLFVDASGFRSELLGRVMGEPFLPYNDTLFCDRALASGWDRTDEPILPYTTAESMQCGWCWRIDHPHRINRGYVFSSAFISREDAEAEYRRLNPKAERPVLIHFRSGRHERFWRGNVVAIGNASGFVEPLESTALNMICLQSRLLAGVLCDSAGARPGPLMLESANRLVARQWDAYRDFLAIHYRFNTRIDSAFWDHCRRNTALHGAERIVAFYQENGPTALLEEDVLPRHTSIFGLDGFHTLLLGQKVPHARTATPLSGADRVAWQRHRRNVATVAGKGLTMEESLRIMISPAWKWTPGFYGI
jgi:tryptophan 7-halogenase